MSAASSRVLADLLALAARSDVAWTEETLGPAWSWAARVAEEGGPDAEARGTGGEGDVGREKEVARARPHPHLPRLLPGPVQTPTARSLVRFPLPPSPQEMRYFRYPPLYPPLPPPEMGYLGTPPTPPKPLTSPGYPPGTLLLRGNS